MRRWRIRPSPAVASDTGPPRQVRRLDRGRGIEGPEDAAGRQTAKWPATAGRVEVNAIEAISA